MEIRCGHSRGIEAVVGIIVPVGMYLLGDYFMAVGFLIFFLISIPQHLYYLRKFYLDKTGVTEVILGRFCRYHSWSNFTVKQLVRPQENFFSQLIKGDNDRRYREVVVLSLKPIETLPYYIDYAYPSLHPYSCVFIGFENEFPKHKIRWVNEHKREERNFEVNREEFISKMNEWGVEIKGLNDQQ